MGSNKKKKRLLYIVKELIKEDPDIILLQEVFFKHHSNYIVQNLLKNGFVAYFYSKTLLIVSKYPFISRTYYDFKPHSSNGLLPYVYEALNWIYGKGYQLVETKIGKHQILFVNTHLLSARGKDYGKYRESRLRQLIEICDYLKCKKFKRIIFGGDFNFDINSPSYKAITESYGFEDSLCNVKGNTISSNNLNRKSLSLVKMDQRIDYIFVNGFEQNRKSGEIIFNKPISTPKGKLHISDHYGLALDIGGKQ